MHCDDLTRDEHNALRSLTASRNKRTNIVRSGHGDHIPLAYIDALLELAIIERVGDTFRVIKLCPGHSASPPTRENAEEPRPQSGPQYNGVAVEPRDSRVIGGSRQGSRKPVVRDSCVRNDDKTSRAIDKKRKATNSRLLKHFAAAARLHRWSANPTAKGRAALATNMKQWLIDGATEEEIQRMIDKFFLDIRGQQRGNDVWRLFIVRRDTIDLSKEQETNDMEVHRHDFDYWSDSKEVQERKRKERDGKG